VKRKYLGDSYDAVKRLWQEIFATWAPLHADPRFIPADIRNEFTTLTRIPLLGERRPTVYSILNDPDTGIRLPDRANQSEGSSHITLSTICNQLADSAVRCVITFDQSNHREPGLTAEGQRNAKLQWLNRKNLSAFYYVSHAPFLFAFSKLALLKSATDLLKHAGIPDRRIEPITLNNAFKGRG
jgi:hypothetical protein